MEVQESYYLQSFTVPHLTKQKITKLIFGKMYRRNPNEPSCTGNKDIVAYVNQRGRSMLLTFKIATKEAKL